MDVTIIDQIRALSNGARFFRADMHIHSYGSGGSFDVRDESMTPQNIINIAIANGLGIVSITDHNDLVRRIWHNTNLDSPT